MKKTILAMVAVLTTASMAFAGDLPSKKTTPAAPVASPVAEVPADTSISFGFGAEGDAGKYDTANKFEIGRAHV